MRASLLDVLVGQQVRLIVTTRDGDPAKGEELSQQDVEIVGQLLYLPDLPDSAMPDGFQHHGVHAADGKRHAIYDDDVRRVSARGGGGNRSCDCGVAIADDAVLAFRQARISRLWRFLQFACAPRNEVRQHGLRNLTADRRSGG